MILIYYVGSVAQIFILEHLLGLFGTISIFQEGCWDNSF